MRETKVQRLIWLAIGGSESLLHAGVRPILWRVNSGKAWVGSGRPVRNRDGSVTLPGARPISLGFSMPDGTPVAGASDLCGMTSMVVTQEMVGHRVAIFTAIEAKREKGGRTSKDQRDFGVLVRDAGGIAGVANTPAVAQDILKSYLEDMGIKIKPE